MSFFLQPTFLWFLVAVVFLVVELNVPGFVAIFFALGCLVTSLAVWFFAPVLQTQIIIFVLVSIGSLFLFRNMARAVFRGGEGKDTADDYFNERIGKTVVVTEPVMAHRQGKVKFDGSFWIAVSDVDMALGDVGVVTGVDGENALIVQIKPIEN